MWRDWLTPEVLAVLTGAWAALTVSFLVINLGLRVLPAGRAFLAEARQGGRLFAQPGRRSARTVKAVFAVAALLAVGAGAWAYHEVLTRIAPLGWPTGRRFAGGVW